ncbi:hypothetical protein AAFF_G00100790 [Aldrovandia affinis]|uniref:Uncharacterized protein n=1 Tax=Aldrovandia affinis TaxID=143900 RepID=A0AAD7RUP2_9TELE|nr:hypothetical protein AAFF_G00100790 [Aldrovandia affinis]
MSAVFQTSKQRVQQAQHADDHPLCDRGQWMQNMRNEKGTASCECDVHICSGEGEAPNAYGPGQDRQGGLIKERVEGQGHNGAGLSAQICGFASHLYLGHPEFRASPSGEESPHCAALQLRFCRGVTGNSVGSQESKSEA